MSSPPSDLPQKEQGYRIWLIVSFVIPGLGPGIYEFHRYEKQVVDARAKPGHDGLGHMR